MPQVTIDAVKGLWAQHNGSLPMVSLNKATGQAVHGMFSVIDGKKKIVTGNGAVMDPVDFEKLAERGNTRNWQMSIIIPGEPGTAAVIWLLAVHTRLPPCQQLAHLVHCYTQPSRN
jgi:hypothetical protein